MQRIIPIALAVCLGLAPAPSAAQCGGDCNGDGAVSIGDLITAVNIVFGLIDLDACASVDLNGDRVVSINELVAAVNRGLRGCPATPTPSNTRVATATATVTETPTATPTATLTATASETPTATPTATLTATATVSQTPTATTTIDFPDVSGVWDEGQLGLSSSTCLEILAAEFAAELARRPPCTHQLSSFGSRVTIVDCSQRAFIGTMDPEGNVTYVLPDDVGQEGDCLVTLSTSVRVAAAMSPTSASYFFEIGFAGSCFFDSCSLTAVAPWTLRDSQ